jgi:outer membrane protein OmpA-like peptidoglycan-associated protein
VNKENKIAEDQLAKNTQTIQPTTPIVKENKDAPVKPKPVATNTAPFTNKVHFAFNAISLTKDEKQKLNDVIEYLKANTEAQITLIGHTDSEGEEKLNKIVGKKRALFVSRVLTIEGISSDRISVESKGKTTPIASNDSEEGRAQNRRVEIQLN